MAGFELSYHSVKFIRVHDTKLALLHILLQVGIFVYVVVSIVTSKSYQVNDPAVGSTAIKVKGVATKSTMGAPDFAVFDVQDLVMPAVEPDSLFVTTSYVETIQQNGVCGGTDNATELCSDPRTCGAGRKTEHGLTTGSCTDGTWCDLYAWCPVEDDSSAAQIMLDGVENFTVFVKINVAFPAFNQSTSNAESGLNENNLLTMDTIVKMSGLSWNDSLRRRGSVLLGTVNYNCDLDYSIKKCLPEIKFMRIDAVGFSTGFNYRRIVESPSNNTRKLFKLWGVRMVFHIYGAGGKFNAVPLFTAIGAGMALMGIATVITDFVLEYLMPNKQTFQKLKFQKVGKGGATEPLLTATGEPGH